MVLCNKLKMDQYMLLFRDGADYIKLNDNEWVEMIIKEWKTCTKQSISVLVKKCMPEKYKDVQKFTKHRLLLIREFCHQIKKPLRNCSNKHNITGMKNLKIIRMYKNSLSFIFCSFEDFALRDCYNKFWINQ